MNLSNRTSKDRNNQEKKPHSYTDEPKKSEAENQELTKFISSKKQANGSKKSNRLTKLIKNCLEYILDFHDNGVNNTKSNKILNKYETLPQDAKAITNRNDHTFTVDVIEENKSNTDYLTDKKSKCGKCCKFLSSIFIDKNDITINKKKQNFKTYQNNPLLILIFFIFNFIKKIRNLLIPLFVIYAYFKYKSSLRGCKYDEKICSEHIDFYLSLFGPGCTGSLILNFVIFLSLFRFISLFHFFYTIIIVLGLFVYDHGTDYLHHGLYNMIVNVFFMFILFILVLIFKKILKLIEENRKKILYFYSTLASIIFIFIFMNRNFFEKECDSWELGLNNTYIDNDINKYPGKIRHPNTCYMNFMNNKQSLYKLGPTCQKKRNVNDRLRLINFFRNFYVKNSTKRIAFPNTAGVSYCRFKSASCDQFENVLKNAFDYDNKRIKKIKGYEPEVYIDFNENPYGEVHINLQYNDILAFVRKKKENRTKIKSKYKNVFLIFIDAVSRNHFLRNLKKTSKFIEKFMGYKGAKINNDENKQNFHSFQFFKHYSFSGNTNYNEPPMIYGQEYNEYALHNSITKYFRRNGYITGITSDSCRKSGILNNNNMNFTEYDHEFFTLACDPSYRNFVELSNVKGPSSLFRRCVYGKEIIEYMSEYVKQFFEKYKDNKKFFNMHISYGHEFTGSLLNVIDDPLYNLLNYLFINDLLDDSAIFFTSDHGLLIPTIYYLFKAGDFLEEQYLPALYVILADKKNLTYEEQYLNISINQQKFTTAYDIYETFNNIIFNEEYFNLNNTNITRSGRGKSILEYIDDKDRSCSSYNYIIKCYYDLYNK